MNDPRESMEGPPPLGGSPGRYSMFRNGWQAPRPSDPARSTSEPCFSGRSSGFNCGLKFWHFPRTRLM
jgi:hypothetical protein